MDIRKSSKNNITTGIASLKSLFLLLKSAAKKKLIISLHNSFEFLILLIFKNFLNKLLNTLNLKRLFDLDVFLFKNIEFDFSLKF